MAEALRADGDFWTADKPDHRVRGRFVAELAEKPEVVLADNLVPDPRVFVRHDPSTNVMTTTSHSAEAKRSVASFLAITVHGQLDSGEVVTLINAQNYGGAGFRPHYRATTAVVGAWVPKDQLYSSVRFRMDRPYWLAHLDDGDSSTVEDDGSTLTVRIQLRQLADVRIIEANNAAATRDSSGIRLSGPAAGGYLSRSGQEPSHPRYPSTHPSRQSLVDRLRRGVLRGTGGTSSRTAAVTRSIDRRTVQ